MGDLGAAAHRNLTRGDTEHAHTRWMLTSNAHKREVNSRQPKNEFVKIKLLYDEGGNIIYLM